jgi:hypothetical protein
MRAALCVAHAGIISGANTPTFVSSKNAGLRPYATWVATKAAVENLTKVCRRNLLAQDSSR